MTMTREQATAAVAAATTERDGIQANLLDLDGSFGRRLLAGASLAGGTKKRWDAATAELAALWELFTAYSAVVAKAAELLARVRRSSSPELADITMLLTGTSVRVARVPVPLERRDLTDSGRSELTVAMTVRDMKRIFAGVAEVVTSAESVWNEVAAGLDGISAELARARRQADELADGALTSVLAAAEADLARLREVLNADPLLLWQRGRVDTAPLDRLRAQTAASVSRVGELTRLRDDARRRIAAVSASVVAAQAAAQDAVAARDRAAAKITASSLPPPPPEATGLTGRLATLEPLRAAGRWPRLASELDVIEKAAAAAAQQYRDCERESGALLRRRDELRGLLEAYQAKAARLGAVEDQELTARHDRARELLWTAPCDLRAAADAVMTYQQGVLALGGQGRQR